MADIDNDDEKDDQEEDDTTTVPLTFRERICRSMAKTYKASNEAAVLDGEWDAICKAINPAAALEIYCIKKTDPSLTGESAIVMLKKVKRHLIRLNLTVLVAFEKRMLLDSINAIKYREEHFNEQVSHQQPEGGEEGWRERIEAAKAKLPIVEEETREAV